MWSYCFIITFVLLSYLSNFLFSLLAGWYCLLLVGQVHFCLILSWTLRGWRVPLRLNWNLICAPCGQSRGWGWSWSLYLGCDESLASLLLPIILVLLWQHFGQVRVERLSEISLCFDLADVSCLKIEFLENLAQSPRKHFWWNARAFPSSSGSPVWWHCQVASRFQN